jgi:hypothetical protein
VSIKKRSKINGALEMQAELEKLFYKAIKSGDIKLAAYISQCWLSAESHAKEERKEKCEKRTSLDDLCDILREYREDFKSDSAA